MLARLFERFDALVLPAAQVWPFPVEWRWPEAIAGRAMDTYHRWMEVVIPVSLIGLPALCGAGGVRGAGPADGDADLRADGERCRRLLRLGQAYHRATDWPGRRPPGLG